MAEATKVREIESDSESNSESESDDAEEGMINALSKFRKVNVAVASDVSVWLGVDTERKTNKGGQEFSLELPTGVGGVGVGFKRSAKEEHLIRRIPWQKANPHE